MALDTRYRPTRYSDVLGQEATAAVLKEFVRTGKGFHQSYLFCGQWGSGKTTMGRILARSLLCANPEDGEPCDKCPSCLDILRTGQSEAYTEHDAASKSKKENLEAVLEENNYSTTSGRQRVYLFDEAHRLSKQALDILLKPMEDDRGDGKQLVCIFCTTEPEKMHSTVFSRCAPAFVIRVVPPEVIAERLAWVCGQEGIGYEQEALVTIAAVKECHIRDALKTIEAVSTLGPITVDSVSTSLMLDVNPISIAILTSLGQNLGEALKLADSLTLRMSPTAVYDRLGEVSMLAFRVAVGAVKPPVYWPPGLLEELGKLHGDFLVTFAQCFSSRSDRPGRPTASMLALDLVRLHHLRTGSTIVNPETEIAPPKVFASAEVPSSGTSVPTQGTPPADVGNVVDAASINSSAPATSYETPSGRFVDIRGVKPMQHGGGDAKSQPDETVQVKPERFREFLSEFLLELRGSGGGVRRSPGRGELGSPGTDPTGRDPG